MIRPPHPPYNHPLPCAATVASFQVPNPNLQRCNSDPSAGACTQIFIGRELPPGMQANFRTYNDGLLDAAPIDSPLTAFGRGKRALDRLVDFIDCHIAELEAAGTLHEERYFAIREFMAMTDESGQPHPRCALQPSLPFGPRTLTCSTHHHRRRA